MNRNVKNPSNEAQGAVERGAAVYSRRTLRMYDVVVHLLSNHLAWRCPTGSLRAMYARNVSANHLDVGVGSGYFLDQCRFPVAAPEITLLDLNPTALAFAAQRVQRYRPTIQAGNVLEPVELQKGPFDSIAMMYLLHCIPGDLKSKAIAMEHLGKHLSSSGVLFGATILGQGVEHSPLARVLMKTYNSRQIFCNRADHKDDLKSALERHFHEHSITVQGSVAVFEARGYRSA